MFHANAWGMPYAAAAVGAKQVFFAGALEPQAFVDLLVHERVTVAAGVPTVWLGIADELVRRGERLPALRHIICGGVTAAPLHDRALCATSSASASCRPGA